MSAWLGNMQGALHNLPRQALALMLVRALSAFGSALTGFALNVWLFKQTGSYSVFAAMAVLNALPGLLLSPVAGALIDRYRYKSLLVACDVVSALAILLLGVAASLQVLNQSIVLVACLILSITRVISWPAAWVAISSLTTPAQRPAVNGLSESLNGGISIFSPMLGYLLFELLGIGGICMLDILSYILCIGVTMRVSLDVGRVRQTHGGNTWANFANDCLVGFHWLAKHPGLLRLLLYFVAMNLGCSVFAVLYAPYVMAFSNAQTLGLCMTMGGIGTILGGLLYAALGNRMQQVNLIILGGLIVGLSMLSFGASRITSVVAVLAFLYTVGFAVVSAASQTVWQSHVPLEVQGRVFSVRRMVAFSLNPLSVLVSVPLVESMFGPLLSNPAAAWPLTQIWGVGPAAAMGLMASLCGLLCAVVASGVYLSRGLAMLEAPLAGEISIRN